MNAIAYNSVSLILIIGILLGINFMSSPKTAAKGNKLSAICMAAAIILTLVHNNIISYKLLWVCMLIGAMFGLYLAVKVKMIQMPQMVATFNGFGGAASALVGILVLTDSTGITLFSQCTGALALIVGGVTFSGSMIAAAKLAQLMNQRPVEFNAHSLISWLTIALMVVLLALTTFAQGSSVIVLAVITLIVGLFFGVFFTIRVGGADMPITISLLNSLSGVAGSIAGFAIYDGLLVAVGGIVGASGLLLTQIMCRAMNRSLADILTGKTSLSGKKHANNKKEVSGTGSLPTVETKKDNWSDVLGEAKKVVIVPGYGMALAQAQFEVKKLADKLESQGKEVKFAIHPVAGRMPGHMNVLLAEVDVPYDKLYEMDAINPEFKDTDVVIIIGANDVVNPAANTAEGTPIYGMPVLNVDEAKHVIVCNYDTKPGYAGVDNPLYTDTNVTLLLGDAKETVAKLEENLGKAAGKDETKADNNPAGVLQEAKKVIVVPGYGMALAQAQFEVKKLADKLESQGKEVKFAIHPVAGRMPGHMNVLLAEVDVPYDKLYEMDAINPEFKDTDVVIIIGANDVVNPAANTAEGTPIYGMPVLNVDEAKHVIVCNYDTKPGYAGVDNPLYTGTNVTLFLGDAKETVAKLEENLGQAAGESGKANKEKDSNGFTEILHDAEKVIIIPGYGMALAQAQQQVKQLADKLEGEGKEVKFAIHPVAGRMPGHMNVLLAEVDVPYDKLYEMDAINPEFPNTDVVVIVGANDVVNPAANTAEGTPIYGMPILEAEQAKHVIICNYDTKPGYAGVDNPLYEQDNAILLLGDAAETVKNMVAKIS